MTAEPRREQVAEKAHLRRCGALGRTPTLGEPEPDARRANPEILASVSEPRNYAWLAVFGAASHRDLF